MSGGLRHHNDEEKRARAMRLDTESSKQDRYDRKQTSARALMENHAHFQEKSFSLHLDIADVVRDVEKLLPPKFVKIKLRQDALRTTFLILETFCIHQILAVWEETGVFQQPQALMLIDPFPGEDEVKSWAGLVGTTNLSATPYGPA